MERILEEGIKDAEDINLFLAWKIGGIDHIASKNTKTIRFFPDWEYGSSVDFSRGNYSFSCNRDAFWKFCEEIKDIAQEYKAPFDDDKTTQVLKKINKAIKSTGVNGFGTVYILTILYFITKGQQPIFDRCAYKAAKAIFLGKQPNDIWYESPSSKSAKGILNVISDYKWYLEQVFGMSDISRDVDRALWVYGHTVIWKGNSIY